MDSFRHACCPSSAVPSMIGDNSECDSLKNACLK